MHRPSLLANPIMGLTSDRSYAVALIALQCHVYFSDLRALTTAGLTLTGGLFYGCMVAPGTFAGATLTDTRFVCCAGAGEPPADAEARRAIADGLRGDWDRAWALLTDPAALAPDVVEPLVANAALGMLDARMEVRLRAMTRVARLLREHPAIVPADAREVLQAFLLYRAADASDMVYYDAVALVDELKLPASVLHHLVGRARSRDPRERVEALVARLHMHLGVNSVEPPYSPLADLLDDDDPEVQLALLRFLSQVVRYSWDAADLRHRAPPAHVPRVGSAARTRRDLRARRHGLHAARALRQRPRAARQRPPPADRRRPPPAAPRPPRHARPAQAPGAAPVMMDVDAVGEILDCRLEEPVSCGSNLTHAWAVAAR